MNKAIEILIIALLEEFAVSNLDDLLVLLARKGIQVSVQVASDIYYDWQWKHRKQIEYKRIKNSLNVSLQPKKLPRR